MKLLTISKKLLPVLTLLLATSAFAADKASLVLYEAATVSGHKLAPGQYQLKWEGAGPSVELNILSKGKVVATAPAHLVELSNVEHRDTYKIHMNDDGTATLVKINFAGRKYALSLTDDSASAESPTQKDSNMQTSK
jgi:hypothetical protein